MLCPLEWIVASIMEVCSEPLMLFLSLDSGGI